MTTEKTIYIKTSNHYHVNHALALAVTTLRLAAFMRYNWLHKLTDGVV